MSEIWIEPKKHKLWSTDRVDAIAVCKPTSRATYYRQFKKVTVAELLDVKKDSTVVQVKITKTY